MPDESQDERKSTATSAGYHFLNTYQCCPWRWYTRFVRKLVPDFTSKYLLFGQAFHMAKELFYLDMLKRDDGVMDRETFMMNGIAHLKSLEKQYEKKDTFLEDLDKMTIMARNWHDTWAAKEREEHEVLAVEELMLVELPGGFTATVRPDVVVRERRSMFIKCFETKTTSYSIPEMAKSVQLQKQVDMQMLGTEKWLREHGFDTRMFIGVQPDITYSRQSKHESARTPTIGRSRKELADSMLMFTGLFSEIGQKLATLEAGKLPPEMLFPRNGAWCAQVGCEYAPICTSRWTDAPPLFHVEEAAE